MKRVSITTAVTVQVPRVPTFLIIDSNRKIPIADVVDDELRFIGQAWTEALIERAAELRFIIQGEERDA